MEPRVAIVAAVVVVVVAGVAASAASRVGSPEETTSTQPPLTTGSATAPPASTGRALELVPTTAAVSTTALAEAIDAVWSDTPGGCVSITAGERVLYDANSDGAVSPGSTTKLLTAAAALEALGAETRLQTSVRAASPPVDGVVAGDLWLVGGGDPVLGTDAWAAQLDSETPLHTSLDVLADRVVAAGVRQVEGRVVGDESRYDSKRYLDSWPDRLIADGEAGPLSALSVNDGFRVWGHPGVPVGDPPTDAAALFTEELAARGVTVAGAPGSGTVAGTANIATIDSPPIGDLVHAMLRDSDNGTAELLVKELGFARFGDGSTTAGARAMREILAGVGIPLKGVAIVDGSGLSDTDRLTCRALTTLLTARSAGLAGRLAVAGRDGTLARRFLDTRVAGRLRAKTGSLDGIAALAGYADNSSGTTLSFAYIINELPHGASAQSLQDAFASALVNATLQPFPSDGT